MLATVHADTPPERIHQILDQLWTDPADCLAQMFKLRSPDHGGQREQFHVCYRWLIQRDKTCAIAQLPTIPRHGTYKDVLLVGAGSVIEPDAIAYYARVLAADLVTMRGGSLRASSLRITNAAKYAPMRFNILDRDHAMVRKLTTELAMLTNITTPADYRKLLIKPLRAILAEHPPSVYTAMRVPSVLASSLSTPTPNTVAPPRELVDYYLAGRPYNQFVENQWKTHVSNACACPSIVVLPDVRLFTTAPRPELSHVIAHVLLFIEANTRGLHMITTTRYTMFDVGASLENKTTSMLKIYDPRGTYININGRVYDLGLEHMLSFCKAAGGFTA